MKSYRLAKIAYEAYCRQTNWKSLVTGDQLPQFEDLRQEIKDAWWVAAQAVRHEFVSDSY